MRIGRIRISAALAVGLAALPLSTVKAQYHPHQQQPTTQSTADQLNREELARHQSESWGRRAAPAVDAAASASYG